ncbi:citramalate synthase [Desulforhopalus singaporensis]|uniref:Citramalate synthase n=1 Tax=Desulforhopalus singaporensis TaxID=91360 RepID=A0A1H0QZA1_9BACT|nr:citramalate synthase [Desulforhopalus singaporensis]SDP22601.1 (R)-citramalate synthase [Desulforhopalus singaporensis]
MAHYVELYDTTLRDGTQAENFNLSVDDKVRIALALDNLGIDFIEGGWPGSNPISVEFFNKMQNVQLKHAKLAAFGSTRHIKNSPDQDPNLAALLSAKTPVVTIFGKSWDIHVTEALFISLEDNLQIISDTLAFLKPRVEHLFYDAEHFFDGFKNNREYALKTLEAAVDGGAETLILCDTNGGTLPHEIGPIISQVNEFLSGLGKSVPLGIHSHNDSETAVANSITAVSVGKVKQIQGTINGFGERCGNANLTSIIPALVFKLGVECEVRKHIEQLNSTSRLVNELANLPHNRYQPYVGESAFAHKGGIHVSAVKKNPVTYEHITPDKIGNIRRILISDQSGRSNILHKAKQWGLKLNPDDPILATIISELKELENCGYQYEGAEASFELLMRKAMGLQRNYFKFESFRVMNHKYRMDKPPLTEATIRLFIGGNEVHTAAMGDGPVNALDAAIRKALTEYYPCLEEMVLSDYKVRVLSGEHGTQARVRVLVESWDQYCSWGTVGVSVNIIEASWQALVDAINYKLMKEDIRKADNLQEL